MRIFGIDIGPTSIGFAVLDRRNEADDGEILRLGVRIFPETRDPKGVPLNQTRRAKRMMRRQLRRRRSRRRALNTLLRDRGLLPDFSSADWRRVMANDPYGLRMHGLDEALTPDELGRALYHLSKRRHFRARATIEEETDEESAEDKVAQSERDGLVKALRAEGETLGAHLARRDPHEKRRRGAHATRAVVEEEFNRLLAAQSPHHPVLADADFVSQLRDAIFFQRPVFWRRSTLARCPLIPEAPLSAKSAWIAQQRRMLEKVNVLTLTSGNMRPLDAEERAAIIVKLQTQKTMTWAGVKAALAPIYKARGEKGLEKTLHFNLQDSAKQLHGNALEADLAAVFGEGWAANPQRDAIRATIHDRLWRADYGEAGSQRVVIRDEAERRARRKALAAAMAEEWAITPEQAQALSRLRLPTGWEPFSSEALEKFLPELETGTTMGALLNSPDYEDWRDHTFPDRDGPTGEVFDRLPTPGRARRKSPAQREEEQRLGDIRNPTVVRVQNELRKVVNNLIDAHGRPDLIRIEVAREVGRSKRDREEALKAIGKRERERAKAKTELQANGLAQPSRADIEKWLLAQETGWRCPFTGDAVDYAALFRDNRFQVEHIRPRSLTFDDSFANKTICRTDVNVEKGNRTPWQAFGGEAGRWTAMAGFLKDMPMAPSKKRRFLDSRPVDDDFTARQLVDTGYAARQAVASLKRLWPDEGPTAKVHVFPVTGRVTAQLRKLWGLNNILADNGEKTRADHRHHAVDALTVACAHPGVTQILSRYWKDKRDAAFGQAEKPRIAPPWPSLRDDAAKAVANIVVSHRVRKKVSGPLHKETVYGDTEKDEKTKSGVYRVYVARKPLAAISKAGIEDICDEHVKETVRAWVEARGGDPKKAYPPYPRVSPGGPEIRKARIRMLRQKTLMAETANGAADLGDNHHIAIFVTPDGETVSDVVSLYDAAQRLARREPIVRRCHPDYPDAAFVASLASGEAIQLTKGEKSGVWIVTGVWSSKQVVLDRAHDAVGASTFRPNPSSLTRQGFKKISIDPIGRIRPARD